MQDKRPPPRRRFARVARWAVAGFAAVLAGGAALVALLFVQVASVPPVRPTAGVTVSKAVLARDGALLRAFQTPDDRWRLPASLDDVDPLYIRMLLAYEDRRFHAHGGVDPRAVLRAAAQSLGAGRIVSGASTLTMQTARLTMERSTRGLSSKWRQVVLALALERDLTKDEILGLYLLRAPFGGNIEGVRAATLAWFGKEPSRLTPAEAALLVALPQAPELRRPDRFPKAAREARARVLAVMEARGVLGADQVAAASRASVPTLRREVPRLAAHATRDAIAVGGAANEVRLTLDADLQARLEQLARARALRLGPHVSVAMIVADHRSGEVLAHVGSPDLLDEARRGHVDMTRALRSPGSTLKPLIYGLAFEEGIAHPDSLIDDRPVTLGGYSPTNFDQSFQGTVRVRDALQASLNVPAVALLDAVGVARFVARLRRAGATPRFSGDRPPGLAVALGGFGLSLTDLVSLYAGIANGGAPVRLRIDDGEGGGSARVPAREKRVLSPTAAWRIGKILSEVPPPASARGEGVAYKTGTSYGYRDAWALGYDGRHVIGVWTGRADGTPVPGMTGFEAAAPILFEAFQRVGPERVRLSPPPTAPLAGRDTVPAPLHHARTRALREGTEGAASAPEIFYPPDGAVIELGLKRASGARDALPLVVKARRGRGPFVWMANGAPVASGAHARALTLVPDGPGTSTISVIDADGRSARVTVHLR
ncbi:penicillin-binding protein 1C [Stappia sp. ES.058]|uniref:penicillin-binding protein 1C n=1 Tax=Stappia sp. ES.058 TaxID=1881061 RepID=UPI000879636A|nr:penicillin-binding protein 1C [Stappia sp. ES.058]SDU05632.1 penicillin-binding protein 1C [Stappia sp. ES.058]